MTRKELDRILSQAKGSDGTTAFDKEAFYNGPKGVDEILKEVSRRKGQEVHLSLSDGRPTKFSIHVLAFAIWHDMMLSETHRTFKKGGSTTVKAEGQLVSETHRQGDPHAVTICRGVKEEMKEELERLGIKVRPEHFDFKPLASISAKLEPPRESTVYLGWVAKRLVYYAAWDLLQHFSEQPWPKGLQFTDNDGTIIHAQWQPLPSRFLKAITGSRVPALGQQHSKKIVGNKPARRESRTARVFG